MPPLKMFALAYAKPESIQSEYVSGMNLKELSDILGISQTTVSRALNGFPEVNKDTRKRVEEAAKQYGYAPSSIARRLAGKKSEAVGVVYPFDRSLRSSPVFLEMVRSLSTRLREEKMDLFIIPGSDENELALYERMVNGGRVDSFIVVATRRDDERIRWLLEEKIPFVAHGRSCFDGECPWYDVDNYGGMKKAAETLIDLGHQNIALINPAAKFNFAWDRKRGFVDAITQSPAKVSAPILLEGGLDEDSAFALARKALDQPFEQRPTAFVCSSISNAQGILYALSEHSLRPGEDVSIIAWDDGISDVSLPDISVIRAPVQESGEGMANLLLKILRAPESDSQSNKDFQVVQPVELVLKSSVACVETLYI